MTTTWPDHLIDLAEWDAMGEQERRFELIEGVPHPLPSPIVRHQLLTSWVTTAITLALGGSGVGSSCSSRADGPRPSGCPTWSCAAAR